MAKKIETTTQEIESPYVHEDSAKEPWVKTKRGKLVSSIVGGVVVLGATFGAGVKVGEHFGNDSSNLRFSNFGDGDHKFPGFGNRDGQSGQSGLSGQNGQFQPPSGGFQQNGQSGQSGQFQGPGGVTPNQQGSNSNSGSTNTTP